jgi:hypothetical protein
MLMTSRSYHLSTGTRKVQLVLYRNVRRHHKTLFHSEPIELRSLADEIRSGRFARSTWS